MLNLANIACVALILTEIILNRLLRSKSTDKKNEDKNSTTIIWITMMIVILLAVLTPKIIVLPIYTKPSIQYIGVAVIIVAMLFRLAVVFSLGKFFTVDVTIRKDHKLKKDGPYKYLRHPAYFASLMSFVGMGWTFNNWISFLLIVAAISIVLIKRINIEEKVLIRHFGSEYLEYQNKTYRLIPFIY